MKITFSDIRCNMNVKDEGFNEEDWIKAGKITAEVLSYGEKLIMKGETIRSVCDKIDHKIISLGGKPAFPAQISCNEIAAHFCPEDKDDSMFEDQICCLDIGVSINGAIGDSALTVDLSGKYTELVKASEDALKSATKVLRPEVTLGEIGKEIKDTIASYGYSPVRNLSGHGLGINNIHDKPTIPNFDTGDITKLKEGEVIAIEPFASTGAGIVYESSPSTIFMMVKKKPVRNIMVRDVLKQIESYEGLPFTTRWLTKKFPEGKVRFSLNHLMQLEVIKDFPPLVDKAKGMVSQAEHSFIVRDKPVVLTKR